MGELVQYYCDTCYNDGVQEYKDDPLPTCIHCKTNFCKYHGRVDPDDNSSGICDDCWEEGKRWE